MKAKDYPSVEYLHSRFSYDAESGRLFWLPASYEHYGEHTVNWNGQFAGKEAGSRHRRGYLRTRLGGQELLLHRICWAMTNGAVPIDLCIDHINGVRDDNRIVNLRLATFGQNQHNMRTRRNGLKGVQPNARKWIASIYYNGTSHHIGSFFTEIEANAAYYAAAQEVWGEYARQG